MALFFKTIVPADPAHQLVGVDFGEPTRDCAGRGQICRIDEFQMAGKWRPDAFGEAWLDPEGNFHLSCLAALWDGVHESQRDTLDMVYSVPLPLYRGVNMILPCTATGKREKDKIHFELPVVKGK